MLMPADNRGAPWGRQRGGGGTMFSRRLARICAAAVVVMSVCSVIGAVPAGALPQPVTNLSYAPGPYETLSVFPAAMPGARLVVMVHGGGWLSYLDNYGNTPAAATDLQAAGFTVVVVNYAPATLSFAGTPLQVQTAEVTLATQWALANATLYNGDPNHLTLVGLSAGGGPVATVSPMLPPRTGQAGGTRPQSPPPGPVKAVVPLSGAFDFPSLLPDGLLGLTPLSLAYRASQALGCQLSTCPRSTEVTWSPDRHVTPTNCPGTWLLFNSENELMPLDQPASMTVALAADGCNVEESIVPGTGHAYDYWNGVVQQVISTIQARG